MRFSAVFAAAALAGSALAADHVVVAGNGGLTFNPDSITAAEGDTVTFKFWPKNHSVAQATFDKPCAPASAGFWSGFIPSSANASTTTFMYTVKNASAPIWFYCSQATHCQSGMVGVINAPSSGAKTLAAFKEAAGNATSNVSPTTTAGANGMIMSGTAKATGAASTLNANGGLAFTGLMGMFAYLMM